MSTTTCWSTPARRRDLARRLEFDRVALAVAEAERVDRETLRWPRWRARCVESNPPDNSTTAWRALMVDLLCRLDVVAQRCIAAIPRGSIRVQPPTLTATSSPRPHQPIDAARRDRQHLGDLIDRHQRLERPEQARGWQDLARPGTVGTRRTESGSASAPPVGARSVEPTGTHPYEASRRRVVLPWVADQVAFDARTRAHELGQWRARHRRLRPPRLSSAVRQPR